MEKNTTKLQAEIDGKLGQLRSELASFEQESAGRKQRLEQDLSVKEAEFKRSHARRVQEFEQACEVEREQLRLQREALDHQSLTLSGNLQAVADQLKSGRDALVNQFLAIAPLLQQFRLLGETTPSRPPALPSQDSTSRVRRDPLKMPAYFAKPPIRRSATGNLPDVEVV